MMGRFMSSGISVFIISNIETDKSNKLISFIANDLSNLEFDIRVKKTNSNQLDSNIDLVIENKLSKLSEILPKKSRIIEAGGEKIGKLDIAIIASNGLTYFIEIEKSNKKTLWFDYVKLLTLIKSKPNSYGIIICPKNYAHKTDVWNLYSEAVKYKAHLARVFDSSALERIFIIGYTQYAYLEDTWKPFSTSVVQKIKNT
jgi:hypothetical protein